MERIARIKEELVSMVEDEIARCGLHAINTEELGEVADIIKDLSEACYYCEKAKEARMCNEEMGYDYEEGEREFSRKEGRMFYSGSTSMKGSKGKTLGGMTTYPRDGGKGGRRGYSDSKIDSKELEHYINDLSDELIDILKDVAPEDKAMFQQKITSLANKIK